MRGSIRGDGADSGDDDAALDLDVLPDASTRDGDARCADDRGLDRDGGPVEAHGHFVVEALVPREVVAVAEREPPSGRDTHGFLRGILHDLGVGEDVERRCRVRAEYVRLERAGWGEGE